MSLKIIRRKALLVKLGFSSATLHRKIISGEFPRPLELGPNMRGWLESWADEYINNLKKSDNPSPVAPGAKRGRKPGTKKGGNNG